MARSWKPEVYVDSEWATNSLRFKTEDEAYQSARQLGHKWMLVSDWRSSPSDDEPNYEMKSGIQTRIQGADDNG